MTHRNPYQVLQLSEDASYQQIKNRYKHMTKLIHPDKQRDHRQIAKKHFQQIQRAYKSISSPLRRYIFGEFGLPGINLLDQYPQQFIQFEEDQLNHEQKLRLKQKIIYILYETHASTESDKNKFNTKTVINANKTIKSAKQQMLIIPDVQKSDFELEIPLPEVKRIINVITIAHRTQNLPRQAKSQMQFNLTSMRRVYDNYVLTGAVAASQNEINTQLTIQKIVNSSFHLRFTPLVTSNKNIGLPRVSFQKAYQNLNFSGITDFQHINLEIANNSKSKVNKSIKIIIERNAMALIPKIQKELNDRAKIFVQVMVSASKEGNSEGFQFKPGLLYGIRLKMTEELRFEIASSMGYQNFLQLSLMTPKYKVSLPVINDVSTHVQKQGIKIGIMLFVFTLFSYQNYRRKRSDNLRQKYLKVSFNRLTDQKSAINRNNGDCQFMAKEIREKEMRFRGLVILKAFIGAPTKIENLRKFVKNQKKKWRNPVVSEEYSNWKTENFKSGDIEDQLFDITDLVQSKVLGAKLNNFRYNEANPCILEDQEEPQIAIFYWLRGQRSQKIFNTKQSVTIGEEIQKDSLLQTYVKKVLQIIF